MEQAVYVWGQGVYGKSAQFCWEPKIALNIKSTLKKNNLKWIIDLNVKPKTIKLLEESIGENLCDLGLDKNFLNRTLKAQCTYEQTPKLYREDGRPSGASNPSCSLN